VVKIGFIFYEHTIEWQLKRIKKIEKIITEKVLLKLENFQTYKAFNHQ
jgi:hypothetical protein